MGKKIEKNEPKDELRCKGCELIEKLYPGAKAKCSVSGKFTGVDTHLCFLDDEKVAKIAQQMTAEMARRILGTKPEN